MSISVNWAGTCTVVETLEGEFVSDADATVTVNGLNDSGTFTGSTAVPVTKHSSFSQAMTDGAASIDLTSLPGLNGEAGAVDGTGLKVQLVRFKNPDDNANNITITFGALNPYNLFGATFVITLAPGQDTGPMYLDDAAPDVASGAKQIDISGTGVQALDCQFVMG